MWNWIKLKDGNYVNISTIKYIKFDGEWCAYTAEDTFFFIDEDFMCNFQEKFDAEYFLVDGE